ncbi:hypothetical protein TeGR_g7277 [Tetraparma gracilis]|uniref:Uncharacterized protein n=1 Tax=Tetraparma gracilis TaxID=2962635 RepID=A0ABQ6M3E0_9STRA|nr:hypothetical protein TeGR_g7277 [Tetraparma gracilis]
MGAASSGCSECVDAGNIWCEGDSFFSSPSVCVDGETFADGFFQSCDDYSFGAGQRDSSWDCTFNNPNGLACLISIICSSVILVVCLGMCATMKKDQRWKQNGGASSMRQDPPVQQFAQQHGFVQPGFVQPQQYMQQPGFQHPQQQAFAAQSPFVQMAAPYAAQPPPAFAPQAFAQAPPPQVVNAVPVATPPPPPYTKR